MPQVIENVSDTAFMIAGYRALESERPEPLFRDPLAAKLVGEEADRLGRPVPLSLPLRLWIAAMRPFVPRARREEMKRFVAYVLLVPD